jgi:hypothetical protein
MEIYQISFSDGVKDALDANYRANTENQSQSVVET